MGVSVFRINMNNIPQAGVPDNTYRMINWSGVKENMDGIWTVNGFVPKCGVFDAQWQIGILYGFGGQNPRAVAKMIRNAVWDTLTGLLLSGEDMQASEDPGFLQTGVASTKGSFSAYTNGTDNYNLFINVSAADPAVGCTLDGNPAHTWLSGKSFW